MIVFINDRPLIVSDRKDLASIDMAHFDQVLDLRLVKLKSVVFAGHILLINSTSAQVTQLLDFFQLESTQKLLSLTLLSEDVSAVEETIKSSFTVVKAAGGVVKKDEKILLIYRRKHWDLPKGKLDKGEKSKTAAIREIEEETGVKAALKKRICTTWHTYTENNNRILKRTKWYLLDAVDDLNMAPQAEEGIEKIGWYTQTEANALLISSFSSIRYVIESLKKLA